MFKKTLLGLATLGLAAAAVPATAQDVRFRLSVNSGHPEYVIKDRYYRDHFRYRYNYRHFPRCTGWKVAVQNPYRPGRYICMDRRVYNDFTQWYRPY